MRMAENVRRMGGELVTVDNAWGQQVDPEQSWRCHRTMHELLVEGLTGIGVEFAVDEAYRLPQLNVVSAEQQCL